MTHQQHTSADQDSMMALQALLNIRRDSVVSRNEASFPAVMTPDRVSVPNPLAVGSMSNAIPTREVMARHGFSTDASNEYISAGGRIKSNLDDVRRNKIENALRSKPQRGRKRDDLSVEERMELTRTRNREHAKSTRVRKKARYQELLDREHQFDNFKQAEALLVTRIESFKCYLIIRQDMLRARLGVFNGSQQRTLAEVVAEGFNLEGQSIHHLDTSLMDQLKSHGKYYAEVSYSVNENVIAINPAGIGFAEVTLMTDRTPFITAFTKFQFQTGSSKLSSMCWCPIRSAPRESLSCQKSYPSVVSLDPINCNPSNCGSVLDYDDGGGLDVSL